MKKVNWQPTKAEYWHKLPAPARPWLSEVAWFEKYALEKKSQGKLDVLILGSTVEFRSMLHKYGMNVHVVDFSKEFYNILTETQKDKLEYTGEEKFYEENWLTMDLEKEFDMAQVGKAAAVFDRIKLDWYGQQYIMNMDLTDLATKCESFYHNAGIKTEDWNLESVVQLEQGRANTLVEIVENTGFIFAEKLEYESELLVWKKSTKEDAKEKLQLVSEFLNTLEGEWSKEILEEKVLPWIKDQGFGNGDVLWPVRVALSGLKNSPGPFEIAGVLGKEKTLERIKVAVGLV